MLLSIMCCRTDTIDINKSNGNKISWREIWDCWQKMERNKLCFSFEFFFLIFVASNGPQLKEKSEEQNQFCISYSQLRRNSISLSLGIAFPLNSYCTRTKGKRFRSITDRIIYIFVLFLISFHETLFKFNQTKRNLQLLLISINTKLENLILKLILS